MKTDYFNDLLFHFNVRPDYRGDCHITCPYCGKSPPNHCSFSDAGFICFVCQEKGNLRRLYSKVVDPEKAPLNIPKIKFKRSILPTVKRVPYWKKLTKLQYMTKFITPHDVEYLWDTYYKTIPNDIVANSFLGYGKLPRSKCKHHRLILPMFDKNDKLVCIRGRRIDCDCPNWLASGGWHLDEIPLFNSMNINQGDIVVIGENPIDALLSNSQSLGGLIDETSPITGVATLSVAYWKPHWTLSLKKAYKTIIMYDNDQPGIIASEKLFVTLRQNRIRCEIFNWPSCYADKFDIGDYIETLNNED